MLTKILERSSENSVLGNPNRINRLIFLLFLFSALFGSLKALSQNDECLNATSLCVNNLVNSNNFGASFTPNTGIELDGDSAGSWGGCFSLQNTVWFKFKTNQSGGTGNLAITNILDAFGNPTTLQAMVVKPNTTCAASGYTSVACNTGSNGSLNILLSGLQPNTTYYAVIDGTGAGANATQAGFDIVISGAAFDVTLTETHQNATCNKNNGSIEITAVSGGIGTLTYSLNSGGTYQATSAFSNLAPGSYTVFVKDEGGCTYQTNSISINSIPKISSFLLTTTNADCNQNNGTLSITNIAGGNAPYTFTVVNQTPTLNPTITGLGAGSYYLVISDANQCDTVTSFFIEQNSGIETGVAISTPSACNGSNGTMDITAITGNALPVSYSWNGNTFTTLPIVNVPAGNHTITITDNLGCKFTIYTAYVQEGSKPSANFSSTQEICGKQDGTISVFGANGGVPPYTYSINGAPAVSDSNFTNLSAGFYNITIIDSFGCSDTLQPLVPLLSGPSSANINKKDADCNTTNGIISIASVNGGQPAYQYSLNGSNFQPSNTFNNLAPGSYQVFVQDANTCLDTVAQITISIQNEITNLTANVTPVTCGSAFGAISVSQTDVTGGISPYTFSNDNASFSPSLLYTNLVLGSYPVYVKDANGCSYLAQFDVASSNTLMCDAGPGKQITNGQSVELAGATDAPVYSWAPASSLSSVTILTPTATPGVTTTYLLAGSSQEGCTCSDTTVIEVIPYIHPPNSFTPEGDGVNDVWEIKYLDLYPNCDVDIYNRWGQKVFHSRGYAKGAEWDGKYLGGEVPAATYYYVIKLNTGVEGHEDEELYKGSVTVVK